MMSEQQYRNPSSRAEQKTPRNRGYGLVDNRPSAARLGQMTGAMQMKSFMAICGNTGEPGSKDKRLTAPAVPFAPAPALTGQLLGASPDYMVNVDGDGTLTDGAQKIAEKNAVIGNTVSDILHLFYFKSYYYTNVIPRMAGAEKLIKWKGEPQDLDPFSVTYADTVSKYKVKVNYCPGTVGYGVMAHIPAVEGAEGGQTYYMKDHAPALTSGGLIYESGHVSSDDLLVNDIRDRKDESAAGDYLTQITMEPSRFGILRDKIGYLQSSTILHFDHAGVHLKISYSELLSSFRHICRGIGQDVDHPGWEKYDLTAVQIALGINSMNTGGIYSDTDPHPVALAPLCTKDNIWLY